MDSFGFTSGRLRALNDESARLLILRSSTLQDSLERGDGLGEQLGTGLAAGGAAAQKVWLHGPQAVVTPGGRILNNTRDPAFAFARERAVCRASLPVLDVQMSRPLLSALPAFPGVVAARDIVRGIIYRGERG